MKRITMNLILPKTLSTVREILVLQACRCTSSIITARLDKTVEEKYNSNETSSYRKHPGVRKLQNIDLPPDFKNAAHKILQEQYSKQFRIDAEDLFKFLHHRNLPASDQEIRDKAQGILDKVLDKEKGQRNIVDPDIESKLEQRRQNKVLNKLRQTLRKWTPVRYDLYKGLLYIYARAAPTYASTLKVFNEIVRSDPEFQPLAMFDLGSGVGSSIWAANTLWGKTLQEYFCVDVSDEMNTISKLLIQGGDEDGEPKIKNVFHRQFMPVSTALMYDLTVCSYTLLEMQTIEERLQAIDTLWRKTQDIMVIIEKGTWAGFTAVLEARDYILKESLKSESSPVHLVAPCPHELQCPKFFRENHRPCGFPVSYMKFVEDEKLTSGTEMFSYVVLRKRRSPDGTRWPRLVSNVLARHHHVVCRMCSPDGTLQETILSHSKHQGTLYKCARHSNWGDLLPLEFLEVESTTDEEQSSEFSSEYHVQNHSNKQSEP